MTWGPSGDGWEASLFAADDLRQAMRRSTAATIAAVGLLVLGLAVLVGAVHLGAGGDDLGERWISEVPATDEVNHHAPAFAVVDGVPTVYAPVSAAAGTDRCALVAVDARDGSTRWEHPIRSDVCTIHGVADPSVADLTGDGQPEVLIATTERAVTALDAADGEVVATYELTSYGYTRPIVTDLDGDGGTDLVVVDARGTVSVRGVDGEVRWRDSDGSYTWAEPAVADVTGDGRREVVVGRGSGRVTAYAADGTTVWEVDAGDDLGRVTWMRTVDVPERDGVDVAVATRDGTVALLAGPSGRELWAHDFGSFAAIHAIGDVDGDGRPTVFAVARDGRLRAIDAVDGTLDWTATVTDDDVQMMPPPALGDLTGDGRPELVAPSQSGTVAVVDPTTGDVLASYDRGVPLYTHPVVVDADGDGAAEAIVMYADGRLVALEYGP